MTNLISGKEALIALANGENLQQNINGEWSDIRRDISWRSILGDNHMLRLKPRTISINGIEVPAPFKPKKGEEYWCFSTQTVIGYGHNVYESNMPIDVLLIWEHGAPKMKLNRSLQHYGVFLNDTEHPKTPILHPRMGI